MALIRQSTPPSPTDLTDATERRANGRTWTELVADLDHTDPTTRRWAARDLAAHPGAVAALAAHLNSETEHMVVVALLDSLEAIGNQEVVGALVGFLRSEDANLRNGAVEVLQRLPQEVGPHMRELLRDPDSDVRIFAIDILQVLPHPDLPTWLLEVLARDGHVNVIATALDRLAEVGTPEMVPALVTLKQHWSHEPFIEFAVDAAVARITGE